LSKDIKGLDLTYPETVSKCRSSKKADLLISGNMWSSIIFSMIQISLNSKKALGFNYKLVKNFKKSYEIKSNKKFYMLF
jgi:hypothetical protein